METPRIRAKRITAANLIRRIIAEIEKEPKRLDMAEYVSMFNHTASHRSMLRHLVASHVPPACGTVACFAGLGMALLRRPTERRGDLDHRARGVMLRLIGIDKSDVELTYDYDLDADLSDPVDGLFDELDTLLWRSATLLGRLPTDAEMRSGTRAQAKYVIARAKRFLKRHPELETRIIDVATRKVVKA